MSVEVRRPTGLLADVLDLVPQDVRDAYDLDELVVANWFGRWRWAIKTAAGYYLGDNVSALAMLAIDPLLAQWEARFAPPAEWA